jgi:hypothetical protein
MKAHALGLLVVLAAFTTACAETDAGITTKVKSQLAADDTVKARNIDVDTRSRVVTLTGTVNSEMEENKALEIARNTSGVESVVDNIAVVSEPLAAPTTGSYGLTPAPDDRPAPDPVPGREPAEPKPQPPNQ